MNRLKGKITDVKNNLGITLVKVITLEDLVLTSVVIENTDVLQYQKNKEITLLFKETEVIIAKENNLAISIQNKIPCIVTSIDIGEILCQINLLFNQTEIKAVITKNACEQLNIKPQDKVIALIKSNEISLSAHD